MTVTRKKKPTKITHKRPRQNSLLAAITPWAEGYVRMRYEDAVDETLSHETDAYMRPWPPSRPVVPLDQLPLYDVEMCALVHKRHWRGVYIAYCKDNNGKLYRCFTAGESVQAFAAYQEQIIPFLKLLSDENARGINKKHVVALAWLVVPVGHHPLNYILNKYQLELRLTNQDIEQIESMFDEDPVIKTFQTYDDLTTEQKIMNVWRELDMNRLGYTVDGRPLKTA